MSGTDANPFASTAAYYAEHRPGYGDEVIGYVSDRFALDDDARALDLGCGAGQITVPLAAHASEVVGMDPNADRDLRQEVILSDRVVSWIQLEYPSAVRWFIHI